MICLLNTFLMDQVHLLLDAQFHHPALQVEDCTERASRAGRILTKYRAGGDHVCGAVMLLLTHFKNYQDHFLVMVEDTSVPSDICSEQLPATPCIVVCGENPLTASVYMVAVDQMIVNDHLLSFTEALYLMFSLYYILNISYPVELGATLEFLQRCIFRINPHKGTKVEKREKKRAYSVNPRVLSLTSKIAAFDWGVTGIEALLSFIVEDLGPKAGGADSIPSKWWWCVHSVPCPSVE
ncbi:uncharacterized protein LOC120484210 [Pimephales promelas]|uniref:uncharacterized protein LOC120484210 n=1 Tax=Pimephales promelas TaxID=90988 RepID=UPI001955D54F|nr:uncharacterized protein LOC120484210 [Pimephales promelas]